MDPEPKEIKEPKPALLHQISDLRFNPDAPDRVDVIFDGTTTLWRSGVRLDVLIVMHTKFECVEVIGYNPVLNMEAPRVYLDGPTLFQRQNLQEFEAKVREKKEFFLRRRRTFVIEEIERDIFYTFVSNYVLTRLSVDNPNGIFFNLVLQPKFGDKMIASSPESGEWKMRLSLMSTGRLDSNHVSGSLDDGSHLDVIIPPPMDLEPARTHHISKFRASLFLSTLQEVQEHTFVCAKNRNKAEGLLSMAASAFLQTVALYNARCHLNMSKSRLRWAKAINRVLNQNLCAKIRSRLYGNVNVGQEEKSDAKAKGGLTLVIVPVLSDSKFMTDSELSPLVRTTTDLTTLVNTSCATPRPTTSLETPRTARAPLWSPRNNNADPNSPTKRLLSPLKRTPTAPRIATAKNCVSDEEYAALMRGVSSLDANANLPNFMKSTVSRLLMTNEVPLSPRSRPNTARLPSARNISPLPVEAFPIAVATAIK